MKQIIDSGWKLFDNQTNSIFPGNTYSNTQYSSYIRPWGETECNGNIREEGVLTKFDLKPFQQFRIPEKVMQIILDKERKESVILYMFFVYKDRRINPFCWVVTDYNDKLIDFRLVVRYKESWIKRYTAAQEAISYITE